MLAILAFFIACVAATPVVQQLSPVNGSTDGGFFIYAQVDNFSGASANASCRFDGNNGYLYGFSPVFMRLEKINASTVRCGPVSSFPAEASVHLEVSLDNKTFSSSQKLFTFYQVLDTVMGRTLFTERDEFGWIMAVVRPEVVPGGGVSQVKLEVLHGTDVLTSEMVVSDGLTENRISFAFPSSLSTPSNVTLTVRVGNVSRWVLLSRFKSRPYQVALDQASRALVFGPDMVKRSVHGWYMSVHEFSDETLAYWSLRNFGEAGYLAVMPYSEPAGNGIFPFLPLPRIQRLLDAAQASGVGVMVAVNSMVKAFTQTDKYDRDKLLADLRHAILAIRDHPALLGYYASDDTVGFPVWAVRMVYTTAKELDPYHPVFSSISGSGNMWQFATQDFGGVGVDVPMYELYDLEDPGYGWDTVPVGSWPTRWLPGWISTQGRGNGNNRVHASNVEDWVTMMFYGQGTMRWDFWPWTPKTFPDLFNAAKINARRMFEIAPQILASAASRVELDVDFSFFPQEPQPQWQVSKDRIRPWVVEFRGDDGCVLVLAVNAFNEYSMFTADSARLRNVSGGSLVDVIEIFSGRQVSTLDGKLKDGIGPYGTNAYRFNCSSGWYPADLVRQPAPADLVRQPAPAPDKTVPQQLVYNPDVEMWVMPAESLQWSKLRQSNYSVPSNVSACPSLARPPVQDQPWWQETHAVDESANDDDPQPSLWNWFLWSAPLDVVVDTTIAHSGTRSLRVVLPGGRAPAISFGGAVSFSAGGDNDLALKPNVTYNASVWVQPGPTFANTTIRAAIVIGVDQIVASQTFTPDQAYQWFNLANSSFQMHNSTADNGVSLVLQGSGNVWMDDIYVWQLTPNN